MWAKEWGQKNIRPGPTRFHSPDPIRLPNFQLEFIESAVCPSPVPELILELDSLFAAIGAIRGHYGFEAV
jgi:hypothetical protein